MRVRCEGVDHSVLRPFLWVSWGSLTYLSLKITRSDPDRTYGSIKWSRASQ